MYGTCLFCTRPLGRNEAIEEFPVGRRLAFDQAKGRLWVVCPHCGRWNLSPLEERWEAIESCERAYRDTRLRASTENIGLARVGDGLELVRIGRPERPEMAAWRYGSTFARRHRNNLLTSAVVVGVMVPILWTGAFSALAAAIPGGALILQIPTVVSTAYRRRRILARVQGAEDVRIVRGKHLKSTRLVALPDDEASPWGVAIRSDAGLLLLRAEQARQVAGVMLCHHNHAGGRPRTVQRAVERLEAAGDADRLFAKAAASGATADDEYFVKRYGGRSARLKDLPNDERLALEMGTHEAAERRALEGELAELEQCWEEAERVAAIADDLLLPSRIHAFLERHRG
jgi:hypothetical protein